MRKKPSSKREADRLFSLIVRSEGFCRCCGGRNVLQCAHIVSRRYTATRWERGNAVCLCRACHMRYTANPLAWDLWVEEEIGIPAYIALKQKALAGRGRTDYKALLSDLRQRWKETSGE